MIRETTIDMYISWWPTFAVFSPRAEEKNEDHVWRGARCSGADMSTMLLALDDAGC